MKICLGKTIRLMAMGCVFLNALSFHLSASGAEAPPDSPFEKRGNLSDNPELALINFQAAPLSPMNAGGPDNYGYTWDDTAPLLWKEIIADSGGGTQIFPDPINPNIGIDDDVVGPITIGFNFKFYENIYSHVYISTNGLIGFSEGFAGSLAGANNLSIPFDYRYPQNFIAPFWDDLVIGGVYNDGKVAYKNGTDAHGNFFVIEWYQVTKTNRSGTLTFEAILYENGDILFQYGSLSGDLDSASIGIEDAEGLDGLAYLVNSPGLSSNLAILFNRPSAQVRVKAFSNTSGMLNINRESTYTLFVRNTGEMGSDVYDLTVSINQPGWQVQLLDNNTILIDTDNDGHPDTGSLAQNQSKEISVRVISPVWAQPNSGATILIEARSSKSMYVSQTVTLKSVVPSLFALTYRRGLNVYVELISQQNRYQAHEFEYYAGGAFGMTNIMHNNFLGITMSRGGTKYTNLEYMLVSGIGAKLFDMPQRLTGNSGNFIVYDNTPVMVTAPNGNIGIAWIRRLTDTESGKFLTNDNIFLAILDPSGKNIIQPEINVTQNGEWANTEFPDLMEFDSLYIESGQDALKNSGRFHLAWVEKHTKNTGLITTDIAYAVYSDTGVVIKEADRFDYNSTDKIDYFEPTLVSYNENQILLFYFLSDTNDQENPIDDLVYLWLDASGNILQSQTQLYRVAGEKIDAVQMSDGALGLAWKNLKTNHINAVVLGPNLNKPTNYLELANPDGRPGQAVSITRGESGQAILTWMDGGLLERIYYAVINSTGNIVVPPLSIKYRVGEAALETVAGYGNAEYEMQWASFMPIIKK